MHDVAGEIPKGRIKLVSVLSHQTLKDLLKKNGTIKHYKPENIRSAGYDLRLGEEYYLRPRQAKEGGEIEISHLKEPGGILEIPANHVVIVTAEESLELPDHLVGHLSLKLTVLLQRSPSAGLSVSIAGTLSSVWSLPNSTRLPKSLTTSARTLKKLRKRRSSQT